jgi:hypothetical protein
MALLFHDGFELYNSFNDVLLQYASESGSGINTTTVRTGARSMDLSGGSAILTTRTFSPGTATCVFGYAFRTTVLTSNRDIIQVKEGSTIHASLALLTTGALAVYRGGVSSGTLLASSAIGLINTSTWYYIEFKVTIDNAVGAYEARIDESTVVSGTGADTQNGGTASWNTIVFGSPSNNCIVDDLYICDTSGSTNNDFLGNCQVEVIRPQTDAVAAGSNAGFTPSTGTDHGAMVDETTPNSDTDYNAGTAVGQKDSYNYPSLALSGSIKGVKVAPFMKKTDAGARTVGTIVRRGGVNYNHANSISPTTSYRFEPQIWETDPSTTSAWDAAGVAAAEFGLEILT